MEHCIERERQENILVLIINAESRERNKNKKKGGSSAGDHVVIYDENIYISCEKEGVSLGVSSPD